MDDFRLILLLLGAVVIGAIYLREIVRRRSRDDAEQLGAGLGGMDDFDGPRVRRRQSESPALGELEALDVEPVAVAPARPDVPEPVREQPAEAPAPGAAAPPEPERTGAASSDESGLGAIDVDDVDAIAAAGAAVEARARSGADVSGARSDERPTARDPVRAPDPEPPAGTHEPVAAKSAVAPEPAARAPERPEPPGARGPAANRPEPPEPPESSLGEISAVRDEPEQLDLSGLGLGAIEATSDGDSGRRRSAQAAQAAEPDAEPEMVVVLTVMARGGRAFAGPAVREALETVGLVHGNLQIYHRHAIGRPRASPPVFSVANVRNPGAIDLAKVDELVTPGLAMFMRIPGPLDAGSAFQQMLEAGRRISERLDGVLCDETRSTLTKQSVNHIRERIAEHARQSLLTRRT